MITCKYGVSNSVWLLFISLLSICFLLFSHLQGLQTPRQKVTWLLEGSGPATSAPVSAADDVLVVGRRDQESPSSSSSSQLESRGVIMEDDEEKCDVYDGKWVWDDSNNSRRPLYESKDCNFIDGGFRCSENGRPDGSYTKWRWQPNRCVLPRFDARTMLEKLRNKRLVYVGDSIGRNQWESMLCMLASAIADKSTIYQVNGNPITKHMGYLVFMFEDYNCAVEYYRAPFLVSQGRGPKQPPKRLTVKETLKLDRLVWTSVKWKDADVCCLTLVTGRLMTKLLRGKRKVKKTNLV